MRLSFPLAVILALLANLIPVFNRVDANRQAASSDQIPPPAQD